MSSVTIDRTDGLSSATAIKGPCRVATSANITLAGLQTIGSVTVVSGDRVLVRAQTNAYENGIYTVSAGNWVRAKDFSRNDDVRSGARVAVVTGGQLYAVLTPDPISIGVTGLDFSPAETPGYATGDIGPTFGGLWSDYPGSNPKVHRFRDRMFIGAAADIVDTRTNVGSWLPNNESGPGFIPRDSHLTAMADLGNIAVSGLSRKSDDAPVPFGAATIGVSGAAINDGNQAATGRYPTAWAFYGDLQHQPVGNQGSSYGLELAVKNCSVSRTSRPYSVDGTGGAFGIWLAGGGDNRYGPDAVNPPNGAIMINKHAESGLTAGWNVGINFQNNAIAGVTGAAGETGAGPAIQMARGHEIQWFAPTNPNVKAAFIRSQIDDSNNSVGIVFSDNGFALQTRAGDELAKFGNLANAVNYLQFYNSATGSPVQFQALGDDTNINVEIRPKGTGKLSTTGAFEFKPGSSVSLSANGYVGFELTNNTTLTVKARGSDGTVRSGTIALS